MSPWNYQQMLRSILLQCLFLHALLLGISFKALKIALLKEDALELSTWRLPASATISISASTGPNYVDLYFLLMVETEPVFGMLCFYNQ
jgi:hypothetical protein